MQIPLPRAPYRYLLSLGSNLGDKEKNCMEGLKALESFCRVLKKSSLMETPPYTPPGYPPLEPLPFLNRVVDVEASLNPDELYKEIVKIENFFGHSREGKCLPRELDIDILLWGKNDSEDFLFCTLLPFKKGLLEVPHKGFFSRDYLIPLTKECLGFPPQAFFSQNIEGKSPLTCP